MGCSSSKAEVEQDPWLLCFSGQVEQLERWLARGGNPCALDRQGGRGTLLHAAARGDQAECIKVLVKAGADVNAVTKLRGSPLHAAAQHGTGHAVAVLLDSGANPYIKNAEGKSAIDVATAYGFSQTAALMRSAGRPQPDSLLPAPGPNDRFPWVGARPSPRPSSRPSPGPATPVGVGRLSPAPGIAPSPQQGQRVFRPATAPKGPQASAWGRPPPGASSSTPTLPVAAHPDTMAVSASGPAAVATPQPPQPCDNDNGPDAPGWMPHQHSRPPSPFPLHPAPSPLGDAMHQWALHFWQPAWPGQEPRSETSSDGMHSNSTTQSEDPLMTWIVSHLGTQGQSTLRTAPPPAAQPATGGGAGNGAAARAGQTSGRGASDGQPLSPSGGSVGTPSRTSTLGSAGSGLVDISKWKVPFKELNIMQPSIGSGSFGRVYRAKWNETLVAVKVLMDLQHLSDAALTLSNPILINLTKECSLMDSMRHPNVVQFMGVCTDPPAMITEYCGRGSLTDVLKAAKASPAKAAQLSWLRRLNMALEAARGMLYLHKRGIVHRDLKSPNLLVDQVWRVKVADFNLSKLVEGTDSSNTKTGTMAGANPKWLAPEVISGFAATERGDVYSYGVVLWELLTWEIPWSKVPPWTVVATVMNGGCLTTPPLDDPLRPLPGAAADNAAFAPHLPAYTALMRRCWEQNPYDRPSFEDVIHQLETIGEKLKPSNEAQQ